MSRVKKQRRRPGTIFPRVVGALLIGLLQDSGVAAEQVFRLGHWNGFVETSVDYNQQDQVARGTARPLFNRTSAEERFSFRNTGTVVGSKIFTLNFGATLGFEQRRLSVGGGQPEAGHGRLRGFDFSAAVLPRRLFDLTLLANRSESVTPVEFAGNRRVRTSSGGLSMRLGGQAYPGLFRIRSSHVDSISEFGTTVRGLDQRQQSVSYSGQNRWSRQQLHTFFEIRDLQDRVTSSSSNETVSGNLGHTVELLAPGLVTLRSTAHYFDRRGELSSRSLQFNEDLRLRHSESFWTGLQLELRDLENFSGQSTDTWRGDVWLRHRLWESLETEFRTSRIRTMSDTGHTDLGETRLRIRYVKNLPQAGKLRSELTVAYQFRDNLRGDGQEFVSQERHTARFGVPSILERLRPIEGSVVVTDALDALIFEDGFDFELRFIGESAEILPLPGGRIVDGQAILVDYLVEAPVQTESAALTTNADVSIDYGWIVPFFSYRKTDDRLLTGAQHALNEDRTDRVAGVRFRKTGRWLKFLSFNEWRSQESQLQAFDSLRLADSLVYTPGPGWSMNANVVHIDNRFAITDRNVRINEGRLSVRWRPLPLFSLEAYGSDRTTRDTLAADQDYLRLGLHARWNLGKLSVLSSVERWKRARDGDTLDGLSASLMISRRFFPGTVTIPRRPPPIEPWPEELLRSGSGGDDEVADGELLGLLVEEEPEDDPEDEPEPQDDGIGDVR